MGVITTMHKYVLTLLLLLTSFSVESGENLLVGFWKSNEVKTLESMNQTKGVTEQAKNIFEKGFFGQLVIEYREKDYRSRFIKEEDNVEEFDEYIKYKILEETEKFILIESIDLLSNELETKKLFKENNCYYVLVSKWEFKEYFCKFENEL